MIRKYALLCVGVCAFLQLSFMHGFKVGKVKFEKNLDPELQKQLSVTIEKGADGLRKARTEIRGLSRMLNKQLYDNLDKSRADIDTQFKKVDDILSTINKYQKDIGEKKLPKSIREPLDNMFESLDKALNALKDVLKDLQKTMDKTLNDKSRVLDNIRSKANDAAREITYELIKKMRRIAQLVSGFEG
jgi:DNA repair exonuclease SbcCD ATPase subunit